MRVALAFLLAASVASASNDPFPRIWSYRWNAADGGPFITVTGGNISGAPLASVAVKDRARWMLNTWYEGPWAAVRGMNRHDVPLDTVGVWQPYGHKQMLYLQLMNWYRDSTWVWPDNDSTFNATQGKAIQDFKAYMYPVGSSNALATAYNTNWGKRDFAMYFRAKLCDAIKAGNGRWFGVFFDYYVPRPSAYPGFGEGTLDIGRAGYWSGAQMDSAFATNLSDMRDTLKAVFGSSFKVMGNTASWFEYAKTESVLTVHPLDGRLREGFEFFGGGSGTKVDTAIAFVRRTSPEFKLLKGEGGTVNGPYSSTIRAGARFALGIACLGDGWAWLGGGVSGGSACCGVNDSYWTGFQDEYSVNIATLDADTLGYHTGWLGNPIGGAVQVEGAGVGGVDHGTGLWVRYFEHGAVVVNTGGAATRTFTFPFPKAAYKFIRGVTETGINTGGDARTVSVGQKDAVFVIGETPR